MTISASNLAGESCIVQEEDETATMETATISMELDADTARIFEAATEEDKSKLCVLWSVLLRDYQACPTPLRVLMDEIGAKAQARGLTPEKLESILNAV